MDLEEWVRAVTMQEGKYLEDESSLDESSTHDLDKPPMDEFNEWGAFDDSEFETFLEGLGTSTAPPEMVPHLDLRPQWFTQVEDLYPKWNPIESHGNSGEIGAKAPPTLSDNDGIK